MGYMPNVLICRCCFYPPSQNIPPKNPLDYSLFKEKRIKDLLPPKYNSLFKENKIYYIPLVFNHFIPTAKWNYFLHNTTKMSRHKEY